jgi:hypothetical protein
VLLGWLGAEFAIPNWVLFGAFLFVIGLYTVKGLPQLLAHLRRLGAAKRAEQASRTQRSSHSLKA